MSQDPKQGIAGTGEWIDHDELIRWHTFGNRSNIEANTIAECVTGALYRRAAQHTDAVAIPFIRRHSVDADVIGIRKAVESVSLNFR